MTHEKNKSATSRGFLHPKLGSSTTHYLSVPAEFFWTIGLIIEVRPFILKSLVSCERLDGSLPNTPLVAGSKFRQNRRLIKSRFADLESIVVTVTSMSEADSDFPRKATLVMSSPKLGGSLNNTSTITVDRAQNGGDANENSCIVSISYGMMPHGFLPSVLTHIFFRSMVKVMNEIIHKDLDDIEAYFKKFGGVLPLPPSPNLSS